MKHPEVVFWFIVVVLASITVAGLSVYQSLAPQKPVPHTAIFKAGDCFVRNGVRETWEPVADGKVVMVGVLKYLLMDQSEADRVSGGTKVGYYQAIDTFDVNHRKVLCPIEWNTHRSKHDKH